MTKPKTSSWWTTLPGILTGIAAVLTALVGLFAVISPPDEPVREITCSENVPCDGTVLACQASGDRPGEVPTGKWLYGPSSPDDMNNVQGVARTDAIEWGGWSNSECGIHGEGWHAKVGTCGTGTGTGWQRCANVRVRPPG